MTKHPLEYFEEEQEERRKRAAERAKLLALLKAARALYWIYQAMDGQELANFQAAIDACAGIGEEPKP